MRYVFGIILIVIIAPLMMGHIEWFLILLTTAFIIYFLYLIIVSIKGWVVYQLENWRHDKEYHRKTKW